MKTREKERTVARLLAWVLTAMLIENLAFAGFRAVESPSSARRAENSAADAFQKNSKPEKEKGITQVIIHRAAESASLLNKSGVTDQIYIAPEESVKVEVIRPGLQPGTRAYAFTLHGGRINGHLTESLLVNEKGRIEFVFSANKWFANYPVILRLNGRDEEISFWIKNEQRESEK